LITQFRAAEPSDADGHVHMLKRIAEAVEDLAAESLSDSREGDNDDDEDGDREAGGDGDVGTDDTEHQRPVAKLKVPLGERFGDSAITPVTSSRPQSSTVPVPESSSASEKDFGVQIAAWNDELEKIRSEKGFEEKLRKLRALKQEILSTPNLSDESNALVGIIGDEITKLTLPTPVDETVSGDGSISSDDEGQSELGSTDAVAHPVATSSDGDEGGDDSRSSNHSESSHSRSDASSVTISSESDPASVVPSGTTQQLEAIMSSKAASATAAAREGQQKDFETKMKNWTQEFDNIDKYENSVDRRFERFAGLQGEIEEFQKSDIGDDNKLACAELIGKIQQKIQETRGGQDDPAALIESRQGEEGAVGSSDSSGGDNDDEEGEGGEDAIAAEAAMGARGQAAVNGLLDLSAVSEGSESSVEDSDGDDGSVLNVSETIST
jgi:hypothetical protein